MVSTRFLEYEGETNNGGCEIHEVREYDPVSYL